MVSLERLWGLVSAARVALEEAAARKADPLRRTAADHLVAVLALLLAFALVLGSIALGALGWLAIKGLRGVTRGQSGCALWGGVGVCCNRGLAGSVRGAEQHSAGCIGVGGG